MKALKSELSNQLDALVNGQAQANSILNNQIGELITQFKEINAIQKKQQEHLEAVTGWIQKHVEEQEAKKKTPAKK